MPQDSEPDHARPATGPARGLVPRVVGIGVTLAIVVVAVVLFIGADPLPKGKAMQVKVPDAAKVVIAGKPGDAKAAPEPAPARN